METDRFDALTKAFGQRDSRRAVVKAMVGGTLGMLGLTRGTAAAAREVTSAHRACKERTRRCRRNSQCCGGKTVCRNVQGGSCPLDGRRCCGTEGAFCRNPSNRCDCCPGFVCGFQNRCEAADEGPIPQ